MWMHSCPTPFTDHTYKVAHGVSVDLRIWPAPSATPTSPFILYVHGGAFCAGKHYVPNAWVFPALQPRGYHVVSIAYRYTPHVGLSDQVQDGVDAYAWCRENLPKILDGKVDVERYALIGESAGGAIITLLAHVLSPPPKAIVDIYGLVDYLDPSHDPSSKPSPVDIQPLSGEFPEADVKAGVEARDPAGALTVCPFQFDVPVEVVREVWKAPEYEYTVEQRFQYDVKRWLRTHKNLTWVLLRKEECKTEEEWVARKESLSAYWLLDGKSDYPATAFLHGKDDPVVHYDAQSVPMAKKLREMGVDVLECYEDGEKHEFDNKYTGPEVPGWDMFIVPIADFLDKHVKKV
ncbi:hypothetical protein IAT38_005432 [Cryptococcus sp. DSM 104549]